MMNCLKARLCGIVCVAFAGVLPAAAWDIPSWDARLTAPGALKNGSFHVQGMCVSSNAIYFAMYDQLLKTDWMGRAIRSVEAPKHTGDICLWNGCLYAACCVERGDKSPEKGCIRVYDENLNILRERRIARPADGIACIDGILYVGLGPGGTKEAPYRGVWYGKFDAVTLEPLCDPFRIDHGQDCCAGVQNIATDGRRLYVNVYTPDEMARTPNFIVFDRDFRVVGMHRFGYCQGLDVVPGGGSGSVRFVYLTTVNWMNQPSAGDWPPVQALWQFAELKGGSIRDITRHCIYRRPWRRNEASAEISVGPVSGDATAALQKAFDDCFLAGGGTVTVEQGEYAVKGLRLRSDTTLLLKSGAVLKASRNCDDYDILAGDKVEPVPSEDFAPGVVWVTPRLRKTNDHILKCASRWNNAVIRILRAKNVRIVGEPGSVIEGCDSYDPIGEEHFRGVHGISVHDSTNCFFSGYTIQNTGNWAHNVWRSSDLGFEDLTILGGHDGIHITTCDRVKIAQCTMKTGDDCVSGFDNEDVTVRGCSLNTACSAFRFGGRRVLVEDCRAWGPAEYPIRNSLPKADQIAGSHGKPGAGWRTLLALFTYYSDFTVKVRHDPGEITVRNCRVENAQRFLHYNFSGNETWQKNRPLRGIRFENVEAAGLALSLCAYGDAESKLSLALKDCRLSFAKPQRELVRAAHVEALSMDGVCVEGVDGPCARSWGDVAVPELRDFAGAEPNVVEADEPFRVNPI